MVTVPMEKLAGYLQLTDEESEAMHVRCGDRGHNPSLSLVPTPSGHPAELSTQGLFIQERKGREAEIDNSELVFSSGHAVGLDVSESAS